MDITESTDWHLMPEKLEANVSKIPDAGCWLWDGTVNAQGYGSIRINGKSMATHRVSYMAFNGKINKETPFICHRCDIRSCINPHHLYQGTIYQNNKDAIDRDRLVKGTKNKAAKLDEEKVMQILNLLAINLTKPDVARAFGVSYECIQNLHRGTNWGWLTNRTRSTTVMQDEVKS